MARRRITVPAHTIDVQYCMICVVNGEDVDDTVLCVCSRMVVCGTFVLLLIVSHPVFEFDVFGRAVRKSSGVYMCLHLFCYSVKKKSVLLSQIVTYDAAIIANAVRIREYRRYHLTTLS